MPARRSVAAAPSPDRAERRREQLDRIGRRLAAVGADALATGLLGRDQVPVVGLAAVADLDLDTRDQRADPLGHALGLGQVRAVAVEQA